MDNKPRYPIIGFAGLALSLLLCPAGACLAGQDNGLLAGIITMLIGPAILVYALFAGHVKLFG